MKKKYETLTKFKELKDAAEVNVDEQVHCLRTDSGGEYNTYEFATSFRKIKYAITSHVPTLNNKMSWLN